MRKLRRHWKAALAGAVVTLAVLLVGVPYVYIHVIEGTPPKALSLGEVPSPAAGTAPTGSARVAGTWVVGAGSTAGYRVHETLAGQSTTAVGRTSAVTGSLTITGTAVTAASFTVQMAKVTSDRSERDGQFAGRIMDTAKYPTGTFVLTRPIDLHSIPAIGRTISATATGRLTLHGTTRIVSFPLQARRTETQIAVTGDIAIAYGDYGIDNPSFGGFVSVGSGGSIEFLLLTSRD